MKKFIIATLCISTKTIFAFDIQSIDSLCPKDNQVRDVARQQVSIPNCFKEVKSSGEQIVQRVEAEKIKNELIDYCNSNSFSKIDQFFAIQKDEKKIERVRACWCKGIKASNFCKEIKPRLKRSLNLKQSSRIDKILTTLNQRWSRLFYFGRKNIAESLKEIKICEDEVSQEEHCFINKDEKRISLSKYIVGRIQNDRKGLEQKINLENNNSSSLEIITPLILKTFVQNLGKKQDKDPFPQEAIKRSDKLKFKTDNEIKSTLKNESNHEILRWILANQTTREMFYSRNEIGVKEYIKEFTKTKDHQKAKKNSLEKNKRRIAKKIKQYCIKLKKDVSNSCKKINIVNTDGSLLTVDSCFPIIEEMSLAVEDSMMTSETNIKSIAEMKVAKETIKLADEIKNNKEISSDEKEELLKKVEKLSEKGFKLPDGESFSITTKQDLFAYKKIWDNYEYQNTVNQLENLNDRRKELFNKHNISQSDRDELKEIDSKMDKLRKKALKYGAKKSFIKKYNHHNDEKIKPETPSRGKNAQRKFFNPTPQTSTSVKRNGFTDQYQNRSYYSETDAPEPTMPIKKKKALGVVGKKTADVSANTGKIVQKKNTSKKRKGSFSISQAPIPSRFPASASIVTIDRPITLFKEDAISQESGRIEGLFVNTDDDVIYGVDKQNNLKKYWLSDNKVESKILNEDEKEQLINLIGIDQINDLTKRTNSDKNITVLKYSNGKANILEKTIIDEQNLKSIMK